MPLRRIPALAALLVLLLAACGGAGGAGGADRDGDAGSAAAPAPADGYAVETVVEGLAGPTQVVAGPDGRLWVAQLAGPEGAGRGEVVAVDPAGGEAEVLLDGLAKPTGLAVTGGDGVHGGGGEWVWLSLERSIVRAPLAADGTVGDVETVLADLPSNGRSNGTLTPAPDGTIRFDTSGALAGDAPAEGSATLWALDPAAPAEPEPVATGLKHAYAHAFDADGAEWTTEMGDGRYDGEPMPDAVHLVRPGTDHGWPRCVGDRRPVAEHGGTAEDCAEVPRPVALLPPGATPTGLAVAPWDGDSGDGDSGDGGPGDDGTLLVALWTRGEVVAVPAATATDGEPVEPEVLVSGLRGPQHLLVDGDGVLLTEHETGRILRLTRTGG